MDPKNRGRARVKIAVFAVLAVHAVGLMALLMQGCRREEPQPPVVAEETNNIVAPTLGETNVVMDPYDTNNINYIPPTNYVPDTVTQVPTNNTTMGNTGIGSGIPAVVPGAPTEYKIQQNDNYYTLAKKFGVSVNAIRDANPKVDPAKLQVGKTLMIPAPSAPRTTAVNGTSGNGTTGTSTAAGTVYEVKSGDNLTKIAEKHGVTVKALRNANNLTTDQIKVGQKLKIPAR